MAVIYRHNPMPTKGALLITNPRKKKPALRINRHKFAKFIAKKKGDPTAWRKWASKSMLRSSEYRTKIAPKFKKLYMAMAEREKRLSLERVKRASLVAAWKGKGKAAAKIDAVRELMKAPLRMTKAEATTTFNRLYKPAKVKATKRKSKSRKGNPMAVKLRRNVRVGKGSSARNLKMAQIWHDWQHQQAKKGKTRSQIRKSYYYTHLPKVLKRYVKVGRLTDAEAKSLLKRVRKKYRLSVSSPKRVAAKKRTTTAGKTRKTARKAFKGTKQEANKKAKAAVKKLIRSKRVLSFAKFRKLYKGCGHSMKTVGSFYRTYKKAVLAGKTGSAPGRRGITPARRKAAKKRTSATKKAKKVSTKGKKKMSTGMKKYQTFRKREAKKGKTPKQISAAWAAAKKKSGVKVSSKKRKAGKKRNEWHIFTKKFGGRGLTRTQMKRLYKRPKSEQNAALARLKKAKPRKGESKYAAKKRYQSRARGMVRQRGKRQPMMGPYLLRLNPRKSKKFTLLKPVFWASDLVNKTLSTISPQAGYIAGMGVQVLALTGLNFWAAKYTQPLISKIPTIPQQIPMLGFAQPVFNVVGDVLEEVPMTLNGAVVGASMGLLAKYGLVDKKNAQMVAAGSFFAGMVLDSALYLMYGPVSTKASRSEDDVGYQVADEMTAQYQGIAGAYGDGGGYIIGQNSQALGYGGLGHEQHSQWNPQVGGNLRHQRSIGLFAPTDMSSLEGESALAGRNAFAQLMASEGAQGTRWKEIIDQIGFANFQRLASMPPKARMAAIRRLKQQAVTGQSAQTTTTSIRKETVPNNGHETASLPLAGAANAVGAVTGFGAIMEAGLGY